MWQRCVLQNKNNLKILNPTFFYVGFCCYIYLTKNNIPMTFFNPTDEFVDKLVQVIDGRMVIEIGCGEGDLLQALMKRNVKCIGIDPFVDISKMESELRAKILRFDQQTAFKMLFDLEKADTKMVFIVARPCHSMFAQEYLNMFGDNSEFIYIGFAKNLELDFERELSLVRFIEFPEHKDCDIVAVLKNGSYSDERKKASDWDKVDKKVRELKGGINSELLEWFDEQHKKRKFYDEETQRRLKKNIKGFDRISGSHSGGEWDEFLKFPLLSQITKLRKVDLNVATYMVGGGHFACSIEVDNECFLTHETKDGVTEYSTGQPWDKDKGRPSYVSYKDITWTGKKDHKRTSNLEAGLSWLKEVFAEFSKEYKETLGIELVASLDNGLIYEIEQYKKYQKRKK
jgi:hypothetical protein